MKEATISGPMLDEEKTEENEMTKYLKTNIPVLVTVDDMIYEIGRMTIERLNRDKAFNSLVAKTRDLNTIVHQIKPLKASNEAFQETNKAMDKKLVDARSEINGLKTETLKQKIRLQKYDDLKVKHAELEASEQILETKLDKALEKIKTLQKKKKTTARKRTSTKKSLTQKVKTDGKHDTGKTGSGSQSPDA